MKRIPFTFICACSFMLFHSSLRAAQPDPGTLKAKHDLQRGAAVYNSSCGVCHNAGVMGAPVPGDKKAWSPRLEGGFEPVLANSINGFKAMPPRGGKQSLTDTEMADAVAYMVAKSL